MIPPVASGTLSPLQAALHARLTADAQLAGLIGRRVYDDVPEDARFPYVSLGEDFELPDDDHGGLGAEVTVTLHVWSKYRGWAEALAVAGRIQALLHRQPLTVAGRRVISVKHEQTSKLRDPDPTIRHVPIRLRIITEQE